MTGMRRGEVLGLRWSDIDLDAACLSVREAVVSVAYAVLHSTPKSHQARVINLDPETLEQLRAHRRAQQLERAQWGAAFEVSPVPLPRLVRAPRVSDRPDGEGPIRCFRPARLGTYVR